MNRQLSCPATPHPLRAMLATALLTLSFGAAYAVSSDDATAEAAVFEENYPTGDIVAVFEQDYPASDAAVASTRGIAEMSDNEISEALFRASPEVFQALAMVAGLDPQQTP